ncbi:hypothetical protein DFH06DRAFT_1483244 [Mycena polygramma]|nr:hypothetical protein DFH06DRAFT_1483244 [Mycena polygramma]
MNMNTIPDFRIHIILWPALRWILLGNSNPSAQESVAYLKSALATSAAAELKGGQYLALVEVEPDSEAQECEDSPNALAVPEGLATEFQNGALFDLCVAFERPRTPSKSEVPVWTAQEEDDDDEWYEWGDRWLHRVARASVSPPPIFQPYSLQVIYFDVFGTLIDHESGIFTALESLLSRPSYGFTRNEALSPLAHTQICTAFRRHLRSGKAAAFEQLNPYLEGMSSWDLFHVSQPKPDALHPPLMLHDSVGIPRQHHRFVSDALFRELEPACHVDIPAICLRRPSTLAANLPAGDASFVWMIGERLPELVSAILAEKGAPSGACSD